MSNAMPPVLDVPPSLELLLVPELLLSVGLLLLPELLPSLELLSLELLPPELLPLELLPLELLSEVLDPVEPSTVPVELELDPPSELPTVVELLAPPLLLAGSSVPSWMSSAQAASPAPSEIQIRALRTTPIERNIFDLPAHHLGPTLGRVTHRPPAVTHDRGSG